MTKTTHGITLETFLESWDRNNAILVGLLRALPGEALGARSADGRPTVAQLFNHIHYVRLAFVQENASDFAKELPEEWLDDRDADRIAERLKESATVVRDAVRSKLESGDAMERHFDHPILFIQMMIWHEGYHHGQMKLALKLAGQALPDAEAGPVSWGIWMRKKGG